MDADIARKVRDYAREYADEKRDKIHEARINMMSLRSHLETRVFFRDYMLESKTKKYIPTNYYNQHLQSIHKEIEACKGFHQKMEQVSMAMKFQVEAVEDLLKE